MSQLEPRLREVLRSHADALDPGPAPIQETLRTDRAEASRRRMVLGSAAAAAAVLVAVGVPVAVERVAGSGGTPVQPAGSPPPSWTGSPDPSVTQSPTPPPSLGKETRCADLPPIPTGVEMDSTLAWEWGQLQLGYSDGRGRQRSFVLDLRNDPSCRSRDDVVRVVDRALEAGGHASWPR